MRKLQTLLIILLGGIMSTTMLKAQDEIEKKVTFQIKGGVNFSNLVSYYNNQNYKGTSRIRFNIGGIMDCKLKNNFYLQTGLMISSKGAKLDQVSVSDRNYVDETINAVYLQIPAYVFYKINLSSSNKCKMNIGLGPYFAYGIAGKTTYSKYSRTIGNTDTFGYLGQLDRTDIGIGMEIQLELEKVVFVLGGDGGFVNTIKKEYLKDKAMLITNSVSYLSIAYKF